MALPQKQAEFHALVRLLVGALLVRVGVALAMMPMPELADERLYKIWANHAVDQGIHAAYSWGYDWLPFYLYLCKFIGLVYRHTGLWDLLGPSSAVFTLMLKLPMILLNLFVGWLIYRVVDHLFGKAGRPLWAAAIYLFNPAIILATAAFGYQDALHTSLVFLAVYCLCVGRYLWVPVLTTVAFLTKPQAAVFLLPIWIVLFVRTGAKGILKGVGLAALTGALVLLPFLWHGELFSVAQMYLSVAKVHKWLTGCAHNIWWIRWPAPPFYSDRMPLVFGLNGLTLGLMLFGLFVTGALVHLLRRPTLVTMIHICAFLAFAFYMVVTEIHENHMYAMFAFLTVFVGVSPALRWLYAGLTTTFGLGMALALWLLYSQEPVMVGEIRLSQLNAIANVIMLVVWTYLVLLREMAPGLPGQPEKKNGLRPAPAW